MLGSGPELHALLSPVRHRITLLAVDGDGMVAAKTVTVYPRTWLTVELSSVTAHAVCGSNVSHEARVSWRTRGGDGSAMVGPITVKLGGHSIGESAGPFHASGTTTLPLDVPAGGLAQVVVVAHDSQGSARTQRAVFLAPCPPDVALVVVGLGRRADGQFLSIHVPLVILRNGTLARKTTPFALARPAGEHVTLSAPTSFLVGRRLAVFAGWDLTHATSRLPTVNLTLSDDTQLRVRYQLLDLVRPSGAGP